MSTTTIETTRCDLCNYGGEWTRPQDFVKIGTVDLCYWCAESEPVESLQCGGCTVTFSDDREDWTCSCGARYVRPLFVLSSVRAAVPSMPRAAASYHVQNGGVL